MRRRATLRDLARGRITAFVVLRGCASGVLRVEARTITAEGITAQVLRCGDLDVVRAAIPADRTNLGRSEGDPASIVEVWL